MVDRVGFCLPWKDEGGNIVPSFSIKYLDLEKLQKQDKKAQAFVLLSTCNHNLENMRKLARFMIEVPENLRMVRFFHDPLPFWERSEFNWFYLNYNNLIELERKAASIGYVCRKNKVRISFQPMQYINYTKPKSIAKAMRDIEQHCRLLEMMGYDTSVWHHCGTSINLSVGEKKYGTEHFFVHLKMLSLAARNMITVSNDKEFSLSDILQFRKTVPIRLDVSQYYEEKQKYLDIDSKLFRKVYESWNTVKPEITMKPHFCSKQNLVYIAQLREYCDITIDSDNNSRDRYVNLVDKMSKR